MPTALRSLVVLTLFAAGLTGSAAAVTHPSAPRTRLAVLQASAGPLSTPFPVSHLGARWRGSEAASIELRAGHPGSLGQWRPLAVAHDVSDDERGVYASGLLRAGGATLVQLRWAPEATDVEVVLIDAAPSPASLAPGAPRRVAGEPSGRSQPEIVTRAAWGADESMRKGAPEFGDISKLVVHHTVTENNDPDPAQTVRAIYAYHTRGNGWNDVGYNFLVDASGRIYEGRFARHYRPGEVPTGEDEAGRGVVGAHARGFNTGSAGVALLGDFSGGAQPAQPAVDALVRLLAWKAGRHNINPEASGPYTATDGSQHTFPNISGHRDVGATACPGDRLYERLPEVRHRVAEGIGASAGPPPPPAAPVPPPIPLPAIPGFWAATADGRVRAFGDAPSAGDLAGKSLAAPIVSLAATPTGRGYWLAGADGGVFAFGDAPFAGAAAGTLSAPVVHLESTPTGKGYWLLTAAGDVAAFGDAVFLGSISPLPFEAAGLASTPTGRGYWVATSDGRVFAFGDAVLRLATAGWLVTGPVGDVRPAAPIVAITAHPDGRGYWLTGKDGGVFAFGVPFHGSVPDRQAYGMAVELRATETGDGYYVAGGDGAVFAFGDADRRRERAGRPEEHGVVDVALRLSPPPRSEAAGPGAPETPVPETPALPPVPEAPAPPPVPEGVAPEAVRRGATSRAS